LKERLSEVYFGCGEVTLGSSSHQQQVHHNSLSSIIGMVTNKLASSKIWLSFSFDIEVFLPQENEESADGSNCDSNHLPLAALPIFMPLTWYSRSPLLYTLAGT
jgi:hypothetical protein